MASTSRRCRGRASTSSSWERFDPRRSVDLRLVPVHDLVPGGPDPLVDLRLRQEVARIEAFPAHDLVEPLLPALVGGLQRRPEAHHVDHGELIGHAEEGLDPSLDVLLADGGDPPHGIAEGGRREMSRHGRGGHGLQEDALGVLLVEAVELRAVVQHGEGLDEAEVRHHHDKAGRRLHPVVVRGGEAHTKAGAVLLLVHEALADGLLHLRIRDHDVVPGLGVGARGCVPGCLQDHLEVLARDVPRREGAVGHARLGHLQEGLVACDVVEGCVLTVGKHGTLLHGVRTILPNCFASARRRSPSTPSASGITVSTMARSRPRKSSRITAWNSALLDMVEPMMETCFRNTTRISVSPMGPEVAPQVTRRPPLARARSEPFQVAAPTFSSTTSTPRLPVFSHTTRAQSSRAWLMHSSAPRARARASLSSLEEVTQTRAPQSLPIRTAVEETPPPTPRMRRSSPARSRACVTSIRQAVMFTRMKAAASS